MIEFLFQQPFDFAVFNPIAQFRRVSQWTGGLCWKLPSGSNPGSSLDLSRLPFCAVSSIFPQNCERTRFGATIGINLGSHSV